MSRLGAIPCLVSCLPQRMLPSCIKTFDVIFKKTEEESTRVVELVLEGHCLFISGQKHNFKHLLINGQHQISKLLTASLLLPAESIFFKT